MIVRSTESKGCDAIVIGAGPYGLAVAAHLKARGVATHVFGEAMSFWRRHMPKGMKLRSPWGATNISDPAGALSLDAYVKSHGAGRVEPAFDKARLAGDDPRSAEGDEVDDLRNTRFKADADTRRLVDFHSEGSGAVKVESRIGLEEVRVRTDLDIPVAHVQHLDRTALPPAVQFDILIRCYYFAG